MAGKINLTIYQGDDYAADCVVTTPDGAAADLTGYEAHSHIRMGYNDTSPNGVAQFETSINANVVTLVLGHDISRTLVNNSYVWDLQLIDSQGWVTTILAGQVLVTRQVTTMAATASPAFRAASPARAR